MGRNKDLSTEDIRLDALVKSEYEKLVEEKKYIEQAEEIIRHAEENVEDFPDDEEDQHRRFLEIMKEMKARGQLTEEEAAQVFGDEADKKDERIDCRTGETSAASSEAAEEAATGKEETKERRDAGKKDTAQKVIQMPRWKLFGRTVGKWTAVVALTGIGMFALTMTSQANRQYVSDTVSYILGRDVRVSVNSDSGVLVRDVTEDIARADIESQLSVRVPILKYRPDGFEFVGYEIYDDYKYAILYYKLDKNKLILYISSNSDIRTGTTLFDGEELKYIDLLDDLARASIYQSADVEDGPAYGAEWKYENATYRFTGRVDREDFEKIVEKIWY